MEDCSIENITRRLRAVRLQEAFLEAQLERAIEEKAKKDIPPPQASTPKQQEHHQRSDQFVRGDRFYIKNKLNKPATWDNTTKWIEAEGKTATVTVVIQKGPTKQVHFITDNGVHTWRATNNIRLI